MNTTDTADNNLDPRQAARARFNAVTRLTIPVPNATRLHCAAAVDALGDDTAMTHLYLNTRDVEGLIRDALRELGSLPLEDFVTVRVAAAHGRRALRALH